MKYINDLKLGQAYATKKMKKHAKPCSAVLLAYFGSICIGCCGPMSGFFLVKCLWGLTEAVYLGESGLENIAIWLILFLTLAFVSFFGKAA